MSSLKLSLLLFLILLPDTYEQPAPRPCCCQDILRPPVLLAPYCSPSALHTGLLPRQAIPQPVPWPGLALSQREGKEGRIVRREVKKHYFCLSETCRLYTHCMGMRQQIWCLPPQCSVTLLLLSFNQNSKETNKKPNPQTNKKKSSSVLISEFSAPILKEKARDRWDPWECGTSRICHWAPVPRWGRLKLTNHGVFQPRIALLSATRRLWPLKAAYCEGGQQHLRPPARTIDWPAQPLQIEAAGEEKKEKKKTGLIPQASWE